MIDFFEGLYNSIRSNNKLLERFRLLSALRFALRSIINVYIPIYFLLTNRKKQFTLHLKTDTEVRIIVTLTSFPLRINRIWLVIETILRQTKKPDKIVLWLSKEQFQSCDILPKRLLKQMRRGLEIILVDGDLRSHKKYYYALKKYPDDILITIDDDIFYRPKMIEELYNRWKLYPKSIVGQRCLDIGFQNNSITSYLNWKTSVPFNLKPTYSIFYCSGAGTLFPPHSLYKDVLNEKQFLSLTPYADDVWLNSMSQIQGTSVTKIACNPTILPIINFNDITLSSRNLNENQNDLQINNLVCYYVKLLGINPFLNNILRLNISEK